MTVTDEPTPIKYTVEDNDGEVSKPAEVTITYPNVPTAVKVSIEGSEVVIEGDKANPTLDFTVKVDNTSTQDTTVTVKLDNNNSDVEPEDVTAITYTDATGTVQTINDPAVIKGILEGTDSLEVTVKAGDTESPITFTVVDDTIYEDVEDLTLIITDANNTDGATVDTSKDSATGTIKDESNDPNDPNVNTDGDKPAVSIEAIDDSAVEGTDNVIVFEVSQDNVSEKDTTVDVKIDKGTDIEPEDVASIVYTDENGDTQIISNPTEIADVIDGTTVLTVKIDAGDKKAPAITFTMTDDSVYEGSEDIVATIENPNNAILGTDTSDTATIKDEDDSDNTDGNDSDGDYNDPNDNAITEQDVTITKNADEGLLKDDSETEVPVKVDNVKVDTDGDGNPDSVTIGQVTPIVDDKGNPIGEITINDDGSYTFDPAPDFNGPVPTVNYDVVDGNTGEVIDSSTLDVNVTPNVPTAVKVSIEGSEVVI
ncbi:MAG: cadherin-like domain-containing protein, partial [Gammaproteobacteria bacterium]|nr:cadherin-like domain-containing protein [Gammaproteobacteria bacterium]